ncbi:MAG: hypothetical protein V4549_00950 [Bacteroidota bacterium]
MKFKEQIIYIFNNIFLVVLLGIFVWQLYTTFIKYEEKFESPIKFTKQNYGNDYITLYGKRFEEIKKMFPKPAQLSYVGEANEDFGFATTHYVLTQYYLAPNLIFKNNGVHDTIIYNLYNSKQIDPTTNFHLNNGWRVLKDFNNGLIILAK